jgi:hypothetical protein
LAAEEFMAIDSIGPSAALQQGLAHRDLGIVALKATKQTLQGVLAIVEQAADAAAGKPPGRLDLTV